MPASKAHRTALVTSGPTYEKIDPIRFIGNRSTGRQGHAIARELAKNGFETVLVTGPTHRADPQGVRVIHVESAAEMEAACVSHLPVDVAVMVAAVSDYRVVNEIDTKIRKEDGPPPHLILEENPDALLSLAYHQTMRPQLVVGFAGEMGDVIERTKKKRVRKGCDWMFGNDITPGTGALGGGEHNIVHFASDAGIETWPRMTKEDIASRIVGKIQTFFETASE